MPSRRPRDANARVLQDPPSPAATNSSPSGTMTLRYGGSVSSKPDAKLAGWFERRTSPFWPVKRWLQLNGSMLTYRHREHSEVLWTCDLRECSISAGSKACEIILHRPGEDDFNIFALSLEELKLWFGEMKKVSDGVYDFYHFSAKVGHGTHSVIHLGRDKRTEEPVAILAQDKTRLPLDKIVLLTKRDMHVVKATQDNEALVSVLDIFESTKQFYTIVELLSGGTLHEALYRDQITEDIARQVIRDVLQALEHLHGRGIIHGSVNAKNMMCTRRRFPCRVKLMTYGKAVSIRDHRLLAKNSVDYSTCAPEVVCFQNGTTASDVFSAGVLLFRLLSGSEPFTSEHESMYLSRVSRGAQFHERGWENVSESAKNLVFAMLADQPGSRPSAGECLDSMWFREGAGDMDAGDGEVVLPRCESDPKTVIVDFELARALGRRAAGNKRESEGRPGSSVPEISYSQLE